MEPLLVDSHYVVCINKKNKKNTSTSGGVQKYVHTTESESDTNCHRIKTGCHIGRPLGSRGAAILGDL